MAKMTPHLLYVLYDLFGESEPITWRAMMGAYMLYYEGKPFAIVEREELYFKGSKETKEWYLERRSRQFTYKKKGEEAYLYYFFVPEEVCEDREVFDEWKEKVLDIARA
jgi:TfoX/Sxy family transcriptional regulator of competence genes